MELFFKSSVLLNVKYCFFQSDLCGRGLKPLWRAVLKRRGSAERIHSLSGFNCVDGKKVKHRAEWLLFSGHLFPVQQSLQICHIMRGRYESASTIACLERTRMLINSDVGGKLNKGDSSLLFLLLFANRKYAAYFAATF